MAESIKFTLRTASLGGDLVNITYTKKDRLVIGDYVCESHIVVMNTRPIGFVNSNRDDFDKVFAEDKRSMDTDFVIPDRYKGSKSPYGHVVIPKDSWYYDEVIALIDGENTAHEERKKELEHIHQRLSGRHPNAFYRTEITCYTDDRRIDGLATSCLHGMVSMTAYEIKVNTSDFNNEIKRPNKSINFRKACNEFYFVVPKGLIDKEKCPNWAGLIWVYEGITKVITKPPENKEPDLLLREGLLFAVLNKVVS